MSISCKSEIIMTGRSRQVSEFFKCWSISYPVISGIVLLNATSWGCGTNGLAFLNASLNIWSFHHILRPKQPFHVSLRFSAIHLIYRYL
jgi:hypothetical protein